MQLLIVLLTAIFCRIYSPVQPLDEMEPTDNPGIHLEWATLRNRRFPADEYPNWSPTGEDSNIALGGTLDGKLIPFVWMMTMDPGTDGEHIGYHIDWNMNPSCQQLCHDWGCEFDGVPDGVYAPDGTLCGWVGLGWENLHSGTRMRNVEGQALSKDNIDNITWIEKGSVAGVEESPVETYISMAYDTDQNLLGNRHERKGQHVYFEGFDAGPAPLGIHTYTMKMKDGRTLTFQREVMSDRLMPIVPSTTEKIQLVKKVKIVKTCTDDDKDDKAGFLSILEKHMKRENGMTYTKKKKVITKDETTCTKRKKVITKEMMIEADNITAREIIDEDGKPRLLIQWAEPDFAMTFSQHDRPVRLMIHVGSGWKDIRDEDRFLWVDVPVHTGSVPIPPDEYAWVKEQVLSLGLTEIDISGQYREVYWQDQVPDPINEIQNFHNRGYFGIITFPIGP